MKICDIRIMRGPNYWSVRQHKLILFRLDMEETLPPGQPGQFAQLLLELMPGLAIHTGAGSREGGFIEQVRKGISPAELVKHIALEMQTLAGMETSFGRTYPLANENSYQVIFSYIEEKAGTYAAEAATRLADQLLHNTAPAQLRTLLDREIQVLQDIREAAFQGPSTDALLQEVIRREIPYFTSDYTSAITLGYGIYQKKIKAALTNHTSDIAVDIAGDKEVTKNLLAEAAIPVPQGTIVDSEAGLLGAIEQLGYPLVLKPFNGNKGKGATIDVRSFEQAVRALALAQQFSQEVIVEKMIAGTDFRLLVVNYELVAAASRTPAAVVGDGKSTIRQLVDEVNKDPRRGNGHDNLLTYINIDETTLQILEKQQLTPSSVVPEGQTVYLKMTANLSTGGTAADVTDLVHPDNVAMAERIARLVGLDICGIDIMAPDISTPLYQNGGAILEVNAAPGLRMHLAPGEGKPRNVAAAIIDMLFPPGTPSRVPIVAVTGTNGKTTTARLVAHIMQAAGHRVGLTTTDGVYINNRLVQKGDCTGPASSKLVLKDPTINFAVLECARGGIVRSGLAFDRCNVGIVTNVSSDHLGIRDIHTLEEMARVKAVIPESVAIGGYAILNADDDRVYGMGETLECNIAYFSLHDNNPRIDEHCRNGGIAAVVHKGYLVIRKGNAMMEVEKVVDVPATFAGHAVFMVQNILPAILAAFVSNVDLQHIRHALHTFIPSPAQTPGRMNLFEFRNFKVLVDYAHNPAGIECIGAFLENLPDAPKVGVVTGVGDRRNEDLVEVGRLSGRIFDEIIIKQDQDLRGRSNMEIVNLVLEGIRKVAPQKRVDVILDESAAIRCAIENAQPGAFITICCEDVTATLELVRNCQLQEEQENSAYPSAGVRGY